MDSESDDYKPCDDSSDNSGDCEPMSKQLVYASKETEEHGQVQRSSRPTIKMEGNGYFRNESILGTFVTYGCVPNLQSNIIEVKVCSTIPCSGNQVSQNRFQLFLRFLHVTDNLINSNDRLFKLWPDSI